MTGFRLARHPLRSGSWSDHGVGGPGFVIGRAPRSVGRDSRREKENVQEFVAKKREMFLVQMSLDVKKAEIVKLDERAKAKDEALKRSQ